MSWWWPNKKSEAPKKATHPADGFTAKYLIASAIDNADRSRPRRGGFSIGAGPLSSGDIIITMGYPPPDDPSFMVMDPEMFDEWLLACQVMRDEMRAEAIAKVRK